MSPLSDNDMSPPLQPADVTLIPTLASLESLGDLLDGSPRRAALRPRWSLGGRASLAPAPRTAVMSKMSATTTPPTRIPQPAGMGRRKLQPRALVSPPAAAAAQRSDATKRHRRPPPHVPFQAVAERARSSGWRHYHQHCGHSHGSPGELL